MNFILTKITTIAAIITTKTIILISLIRYLINNFNFLSVVVIIECLFNLNLNDINVTTLFCKTKSGKMQTNFSVEAPTSL